MVIVNDRLIARVAITSKDLYVSNVQESVPNSKEYKITLSENKNDAMFLDEREDIEAVNKLFSARAHYLRLNTTEENVSNLIWSQLED